MYINSILQFISFYSKVVGVYFLRRVVLYLFCVERMLLGESLSEMVQYCSASEESPVRS